MYESAKQAPLPRAAFARRLFIHASIAVALVLASLGAGIAGYRFLEDLPFIDAFLNAAMLLGGMGPVNLPVTPCGKVFAGVYALYAGLVFIAATALIFTPIVHRVLHKFHWSANV